jgi:hypothetical protein
MMPSSTVSTLRITPWSKVHAFQIQRVDRTDWMWHDEPSYTAYGFNPKEVMQIDPDFYQLFKPEGGHWLIVWPHGLVTFRDDITFKQDFTHRSGTVYETPLMALFQKGMMDPEGQVQRKLDDVARRERLRLQAEQWAREREAEPLVRELPGGVVIRRVVPGLVPMPEAFVQPRSVHIASLPILSALSIDRLFE